MFLFYVKFFQKVNPQIISEAFILKQLELENSGPELTDSELDDEEDDDQDNMEGDTSVCQDLVTSNILNNNKSEFVDDPSPVPNASNATNGEEEEQVIVVEAEKRNGSSLPVEKQKNLVKHGNLGALKRTSLEYWKRLKRTVAFVDRVKKYLCVPATSTAAERVMSKLTKRRLSLGDEKFSKIMFLSDCL